LVVGAKLSLLFGNEIPQFRLLNLGGANTLRGYMEDWFQGRSVAYGGVEYRFLSGPNSHLLGFIDVGSFSPPAGGVWDFEDVQVSYGFGARLEARSGRTNIYYGLTRDDSILNGKIHVSLGTTF
jgi:outer membrane protein insertion porin family